MKALVDCKVIYLSQLLYRDLLTTFRVGNTGLLPFKYYLLTRTRRIQGSEGCKYSLLQSKTMR